MVSGISCKRQQSTTNVSVVVQVLVSQQVAVSHMQRKFRRKYCVLDNNKHDYAIQEPGELKCNICGEEEEHLHSCCVHVAQHFENIPDIVVPRGISHCEQQSRFQGDQQRGQVNDQDQREARGSAERHQDHGSLPRGGQESWPRPYTGPSFHPPLGTICGLSPCESRSPFIVGEYNGDSHGRNLEQ